MHQLVITLSPFHRWPIPNLKSFQLLSSIFYGVLVWRDLVSDEWKIDPDRFIWCLHLTLRENMLQWLACRVSTTTVQVVKSLVVPSIAIFLTCSLAVCLNPFLNSDSNAFSMRKSMSVACLRFSFLLLALCEGQLHRACIWLIRLFCLACFFLRWCC